MRTRRAEGPGITAHVPSPLPARRSPKQSKSVASVACARYILVTILRSVKFGYRLKRCRDSVPASSETHTLTLRRLMSYIYMEHPFLMFLDHTQRRSTVGRTPLDE